MSNETRTSSAHVSAFLSLPAEPHSVCLCAPVLSVFNCQCHLESPGNGVSVDGMPRADWPVAMCIGGLFCWYIRAEPTKIGSIPWQMVLRYVRKIAINEPASEQTRKQCSSHSFFKFFLEYLSWNLSMMDCMLEGKFSSLSWFWPTCFIIAIERELEHGLSTLSTLELFFQQAFPPIFVNRWSLIFKKRHQNIL